MVYSFGLVSVSAETRQAAFGRPLITWLNGSRLTGDHKGNAAALSTRLVADSGRFARMELQ